MIPVLIGSRALSHWTGMPIKDDTDWDVISENPIEGTEHHPIEKLNNLQMANCYGTTKEILLPNGLPLRVMSMEGLAIIKRSHLWRDLSFYKHLTHYHKWGLSNVKRGDFFDFDLRTRTELTMKEYPVKHPNLMQSKADFFSDGGIAICFKQNRQESVGSTRSDLFVWGR